MPSKGKSPFVSRSLIHVQADEVDFTAIFTTIPASCYALCFIGVMLRRFFNTCCTAVTLFFFSATPLWALDAGRGEEAQTWGLSFAMMIALSASTLFLLRPPQRSDSALSYLVGTPVPLWKKECVYDRNRSV